MEKIKFYVIPSVSIKENVSVPNFKSGDGGEGVESK